MPLPLLISLFLFTDNSVSIHSNNGQQHLKWGPTLISSNKGTFEAVRVINVDNLHVVTWTASQDRSEHYAILSGGVLRKTGQTDTNLHLRLLSFDPLKDAVNVEDLSSANPDGNLFIVQFHTPALPQYRAALAQIGAEVLDYLPANALIVNMPKNISDRLNTLTFVRWFGSFLPAFKVDPYFVNNIGTAETLFPILAYNIRLFDHDQDQKDDVALRITQLGAEMMTANAGRHLISARLTPNQLIEVINWDEVSFVDAWGEYEKDMDIVREYSGANYVETIAGYTGAGVRAEVFDSGFNVTHVDFQHDPLIEHTVVGSASHGAATSGIIFGDGTGNAAARGLMPNAQGIVAAYTAVPIAGMSRYDLTGELLTAPYEAVFQTSSVGSPRVTNYTNLSADSDTMLFDFDLLHCQSQSNSGTRDSRPQAWAKNMVSVGGFDHHNTLTPDDDSWDDGGASIGPAPDGRIKPDLSHFYDSTLTVTTGSTTSYGNFGGTSGATPITCGLHGLFFQMWSDGIFGNATPGSTVFDNRPHLTTGKAMMINTAWQYEFVGAADDMSRFQQGWGRGDLQRLYDNRDDFFIVDETDVLQNLEKNVYALTVSPSQPELRVTMTFLDPAGNPAATLHTINDLNLRVTSPSGEIYWGNVGLTDGNFSRAGGVANTLDTVENVWIENPTPGTWIVEVIAANIVVDNRSESDGVVDVDYALVAHPVEAALPAFYVTPASEFPLSIAEGVTTPIQVHVTEGTGTLSGTPTLHFRIMGGAFVNLPMTAMGGDVYSVEIPAMSIGYQPEFYISVQGQTYPELAPTSLFAIEVTEDEEIFADDFESNMGWTAGAGDDTASAGLWTRVDPVSTVLQTELDHTDGVGTRAFVTGQSNDPSSNSENDVSGGKTTLISPVFDLSVEPDAEIEYWRWFANKFGSAVDDTFRVDITNNGTDWTNVETIGPTGIGTNGSWLKHRFLVSDFLVPNASVQVRFVAEDSGSSSLVEAAVDDFRVLAKQEPTCLPLLSQIQFWPNPISVTDMVDCL